MTVQTVIKVGGGLLSRTGAFELVTGALAAFATGRQALVVPGGGPFADAVRELFRRVKIGPDAAHWMAMLGMDQFAHALGDRTTGAVVVDQTPDIEGALEAGRLPILAPYRWMRAADPLPHSGAVSSDSVAAWVAGEVGAHRVVLIKAAHGEGPPALDPRHLRALPPGVDSVVLTPNALEQLGEVLDRRSDPGKRRSAAGG